MWLFDFFKRNSNVTKNTKPNPLVDHYFLPAISPDSVEAERQRLLEEVEKLNNSIKNAFGVEKVGVENVNKQIQWLETEIKRLELHDFPRFKTGLLRRDFSFVSSGIDRFFLRSILLDLNGDGSFYTDKSVSIEKQFTQFVVSFGIDGYEHRKFFFDFDGLIPENDRRKITENKESFEVFFIILHVGNVEFRKTDDYRDFFEVEIAHFSVVGLKYGALWLIGGPYNNS